MIHKTLKALSNCTAKSTPITGLSKVVLANGALYASDSYVAVRYSENWDLPTDMELVAVPVYDIGIHKASENVEVRSDGFVWEDGIVKPGEFVAKYPSKTMNNLFNDLEKEVADGDKSVDTHVDIKLLDKVLAVFKAAEIDVIVNSCKSCVYLTGAKYDNGGHCTAALSALVMRKRS